MTRVVTAHGCNSFYWRHCHASAYSSRTFFTIIALRQRADQIENALHGPPIGSVVAYAGPLSKIPKGWLLCDGRAFKASEYKELYDVLRETHGGGYHPDHPTDKVADWNIPDYRGRFLRGVSLASSRDVEKDGRPPSLSGGTGGNVAGSIEEDAVGPLKLFVEMFSDAPGNEHRPAAGGSGHPSSPTSDTNVVHATNTKDETRPKNIYVNWLIRAE